MSKLVGRWRRCIYCEYWTRKTFNLKRHVRRNHFDDREKTFFTLMRDGTYTCKLHKVPIIYDSRKNLRRHLYFCHRGDDLDYLIQNGLDPQRVEALCRDCKGTGYEYSLTRDHYWKYCEKYDHDQTAWNKFLELNTYYETTYKQEQLIEGMNLLAEY
jgi:hypothetical protein